MKYLVLLIFLFSTSSFAADKKKRNSIKSAIKSFKEKEFEDAAIKAHKIVRSRSSRSKKDRARFILGRSLSELGLHQMAAIQFLEAAKSKKNIYQIKSITELFEEANLLDSDTFINYAIEKVQENKLSIRKTQRYRFRYGEHLFQKKEYEKAARVFRKISSKSANYSKAKYFEGIANAETKKTSAALKAFSQLWQKHKSEPVTNYNRNAALSGLARTFYQKKDWDKAIELYREIPKDAELWHETLFELAWAGFRAGRFREVLGFLSSLHSAYYEDYFLPESILLRGLVYLSICYDSETEKTLDLFRKVYLPMRKRLVNYIESNDRYSVYYEDTKDLVLKIRDEEVDDETRAKSKIPIPIVRDIMRDPGIARTFRYIQNIRKERTQFANLPSSWRKSALGRETSKALEKRLKFAKKVVGKKIRDHLDKKRRAFAVFFRQYDFAKYEMRATRKKQAKEELLKKAKAKKKVKKRGTIDAEFNRSFFVSRGIEYWPFQGEYWLDEVGNYHFIGQSRCSL